jgi:thiol:disulfide interchange protein
MPSNKTRRAVRHKQIAKKQTTTLLIVGGLALLLIAVFALKNGSSPASTANLEAELDQALQQGRPTFVFLHSLECIPCKEMMNTVAQVYPEFQDSVVLIDVDIYQQSNANLIRREGLQSIPTLVFYDAQGKRQLFIGAMPAEQFHDVMTQLAAGN